MDGPHGESQIGRARPPFRPEGVASDGEFEYVTVGHVTIDVLEPRRQRQPGGGAFYSALQAARMGLRTLVLTRGNPSQLEALLEPYEGEFEVRIEPAPATTTFATSWRGPERRQQLLSWAGPIEDVRVDTDILHLAAVARETPATWQGAARFVGLSAQGLLRSWDRDGWVELAPNDSVRMPARLDVVAISRSELPAWRRAASTAAAPLLVVTAGPRPTTLFLPGQEAQLVPMPRIAEPLDDLGAGDVFAAALLVSLRDGHSPMAAARWAGAAAAVRIEGKGPGAIGDRTAIARRRRLAQDGP